MIKIIIISSVHPWNDTRIYHREAKTLQELGYQVTLYGIHSTQLPVNNPGKVYIVPLVKKKMFKRINYWKKFYKIAKEKNVDCIHLHDPELLLLAYFIKKRTNKIVIFDMHENFPKALKSKTIMGKSIPKWGIFVVKKIEKKILNHLDAVIFAEKSYRKEYPQLMAKVDVLNYPFKLKNNDKINHKNIPTIIYAGAMHEIRGFKEMLEVARRLEQQKIDFQLVLIGEIPLRLLEYYTSFSKKYNLENKIIITGRLDFEELTAYYQQATVGLALLYPEPNYLESLPTKIFEYMSFGIPYVASDFPLWKKLVHETKSGLVVDPKNVTEITSLVKTILVDSELRSTLGRNGRKAHLDEYNWESEAVKLKQLYIKLTKEIT